MPIYEYECAKCGKTIEVIQKMTDAPLKKHEQCGGKLTKLVSAAGFQFKGTGWYVTDYARKDASAESGEGRETKDAKDAKAGASNGGKEGGGSGKAATEKAGATSSSSKSSSRKG